MKGSKSGFQMKYFIAILVALVFVLALPRAAYAYDVWVGGVQVDATNEDDVLHDGKVSYIAAKDSKSARLILNGATIHNSYVDGTKQYGIYSKDPLVIELKNNSKVLQSNPSGTIEVSCGVKCEGDRLIIEGDGRLDIQPANSKTFVEGIDGQEVEIKGKASINISPSEQESIANNQMFYGIYAANLLKIYENAKIDINGPTRKPAEFNMVYFLNSSNQIDIGGNAQIGLHKGMAQLFIFGINSVNLRIAGSSKIRINDLGNVHSLGVIEGSNVSISANSDINVEALGEYNEVIGVYGSSSSSISGNAKAKFTLKGESGAPLCGVAGPSFIEGTPEIEIILRDGKNASTAFEQKPDLGSCSSKVFVGDKKDGAKLLAKDKYGEVKDYRYVKITGDASGGDSGDASDGGGTPGGASAEGWMQDMAGWWYRNADGSWPANMWKKINEKWYYFRPDGYMATGWIMSDSNWYYLGEANDGSMATGWVISGGKWYYLSPTPDHTYGMMLANTTVDGYNLGADGAWIQ